MRRLILVLLLMALFAGCKNSGKDEKSPYLRTIAVGAPATDFQYNDMNERPFRLSEKKGSVVLLFFWRMKCPECKDSMDSLEALHKRFRDKGLIVVAVDADTMHSAPLGQLLDFYEKRGYTFLKIRDDEGFVSEAFDVLRAPRAFIIDKNGVIASIKDGQTDWMSPENVELVETLLKK